MGELARGSTSTAARRTWGRFSAGLPTLISLVVVLMVWEAGARTGLLNEFFTGRPSGMAVEAVNLVQMGEFWRSAQVTGIEFAVGFVAAVVVGVPLGLVAGWYRRVGYMVAPWMDAFNATPRIALLPLVILWFGIGIESKIFIIFLSAAGLILMNTYLGVRTVDSTLIDVSRVFGASEFRRFRQVILPSTAPFILVGVRMGLGAAVVGVIFAESYGAVEGLGHMMQLAARSLNVNRYFLIVVIFTLIGAVSFAALSRLERRVRSWRPELDG